MDSEGEDHRDFYGILGVAKTSTESVIKAAHRRLALLYHPDRHSDNPDYGKYSQCRQFISYFSRRTNEKNQLRLQTVVRSQSTTTVRYDRKL